MVIMKSIDILSCYQTSYISIMFSEQFPFLLLSYLYIYINKSYNNISKIFNMGKMNKNRQIVNKIPIKVDYPLNFS